MKKLISRNAFLAASLLCFLMVLPSSASAKGRNNHNSVRNDRSRQEVVYVNHHKYHYRDGRFYVPAWFGFKFIISTPPSGARVSFLPRGYKIKTSRGITYYYYDNVYYKSCPDGYVVVSYSNR